MMNKYLKIFVGLFLFSAFLTSCEPEQLPQTQAQVKKDIIHPVGSGDEYNEPEGRKESDL